MLVSCRSMAMSAALARAAVPLLSRAASKEAAPPRPRVIVSDLVAAAAKNNSRERNPPPTGSILEIVESSQPKPVMRRTSAIASRSSVKTARKKAEPVLELVRGLNVDDALRQLQFSPRLVARTVHELVKAAVANAENNFGMRRERLLVSETWTGRATPLRRILYANKGRAGQKSRYRTHLYVKVEHVPYREGETRFGRNARPHTPESRELHRVISQRLEAIGSTAVTAGGLEDLPPVPAAAAPAAAAAKA
eukprot:c45782_g1_i1.p1 GENE.c45782_g1_i1~~c45782_g1_i1.p1  ORF type:complete len:262 (+),score=25.32 c45782_g1_i1:36-788(+)